MNKQNSLRQRIESYLKENEKSASPEDIKELKQILLEFLSDAGDPDMQNQVMSSANIKQIERYSDFFKNAPVGYLILDSELKINKINKTACAQLGQSSEQLNGKSFVNFVEEEYHKLFHSCFNEFLVGNNFSQCDIKLKLAGQDLFARIIVNLVVPENDTEKYRVAFIDISKEKELEDKLLEESKKAREHERLNKAFMANVSHEIRTPMNGIMGFSGLMLEPDLSAENLQSYISMIQKSGKRMLSLINELIDISKIEAGTDRRVLTSTNVNELLDYLHEFFLSDADKKGLKFEIASKDDSETLHVTTDKEKLQAVFVNVIKNAINFTSEGKISIGYNINDDHILFHVKDTGLGISKNEQERVFERFYKTDDAENNYSEGAGLGLSISKAYIEILGGTIGVKSEPGKGSTFYFTIPLIETDKKSESIETQLPSVSDPGELLEHLIILVAEDDESTRLYLSHLLEEKCKKLFFAKNGREAVNMYSEVKPHLVLMDVKMPIMDGYSAAIKIKGMYEDAVIIAQTAFALAGDREKALAAGCTDYLSKPVRKENILAMIRAHFM